MDKKLLSTSSPFAMRYVCQQPVMHMDEYFPEHAVFMRPLTKDDEQAVGLLLVENGFSPEEAHPSFGIFNQSHKLQDIYDDYRHAIHNGKVNDWALMWMH